jgi:hypothetical protein
MTTLAIWLDYDSNLGAEAGALVQQAGVEGVIRYTGIGNLTKRITKSEYQSLAAAGRLVKLVAESTTTEDDNGYAAGVADAKAAEAERIACGMPANTVIYAVNDKTTYTAADLEYVRGFQVTLGWGRTGAYGFASFILAVYQHGYASEFWQSGPAPSRTGTDAFVHFWQRQGTAGPNDTPASPTTIQVGPVIADLNNRRLALASAPPITPGGNMSGAHFELKIDYERGHARMPYEAKASGSQVVDSVWLAITATYGDLHNIRMIVQDGAGNILSDTKTTGLNWLQNKQGTWSLPGNGRLVTFDWDPAQTWDSANNKQSGPEIDSYVVYTTLV